MPSIRTPEFDRGTEREDGTDAAVAAVRERARPLTPGTTDDLADQIGDRPYVLLGEATHGTAEFYRTRARLTAHLIEAGAVDFVAVEGDWTDCYEIHRYVTGQTDPDGGAREVLDSFDRWPTWMWANWEALEFVEWLREHNADRPEDERVGFYGMDVYSLFESMAAVIEYLEDVDPEAADRAREAYACFEPYGADAQSYASSLRLAPEDCADEVVDVLTELRAAAPRLDDGRAERFAAEQNALVATNAEEYYRALIDADIESWNVRDEHMVETLERLREYHGGDARAVVWAHNTHVGDARATDMARRDKVNVGQLVRERIGPDEVAIVGFGTYRGSVIAGTAWDAPAEAMTLPEARPGSYEAVFREAGVGDATLTFGDDEDGPLSEARGHRAVGVVYHPKREFGNYVPTVLPDRYDAFCYVEDSRALHPLHGETGTRDPPETYPWGV